MPRKRVVKLTEVLAKRNKAEVRDMRAMIREYVDELCTDMDSIDGFAIVIWDRKGNPSSDYYVGGGAIGPSLMPAYVHDRLQRQLTQNLMTEEEENNGST